jgi:hypothetical protein
LYFNDSDRPYVISQINNARFYNASPTCFGTRSLVIDIRRGLHDATRLASLIGASEPRKNGSRWRVRMKGPKAEALLAEVMPFLDDRARERAVAALDRVAA